MANETNYLIKDLERRYQMIMELDRDALDHEIFYGALHDYIGATKKAISESPAFHAFDHKEHDRFEQEVCQKVMNDESIPKDERNYKVVDLMEFYYAPIYDMLSQISDKIDENMSMQELKSFLKWSGFGYREYLKQIHPSIIAVLEKELVSIGTEQKKDTNSRSGIYYNSKTGIGLANGKEFKFKDHQPEFFVFGKLFEQIGEPLKKEDVLKIAKYQGGMATYFINSLVKKIRTKTKLNTRQIVLNNGNITLVGQKLEDFPK